jgi:hypothetical protein
MNIGVRARIYRGFVVVSLATAGLLLSQPALSQMTAGQSAKDRWLHVRVENQATKDETVRVNVPLEMAEKVLPTIHKNRLQYGKVRLREMNHDVDLRALLDAVRSSKDGEFVTVQQKDADVKVSKQNGYLFVHVVDKKAQSKGSQVDVKLPMKVVDALLSAGGNELDLVAGVRALYGQPDTELVSVRDRENIVRVWLDSKNVSD